MKKLTIIWILIMLMLTFSLILIGINLSNKNKPYKDFESDITEAMKVYFGQDTNLTKLPKGKEITKVTLDELRDFGLKVNIQNTEDKCDGYGIVKKSGLSYSYEAFIKCKNYTTKDYK